MNELILTEEAAIEAYETNNPSDDHATGVRLVAIAQAKKILEWIDKIGEEVYDRQWAGDDFVVIDYIRIKQSDIERLRKAVETTKTPNVL
jgi:hypothetical protein